MTQVILNLTSNKLKIKLKKLEMYTQYKFSVYCRLRLLDLILFFLPVFIYFLTLYPVRIIVNFFFF